MAFPRFARGAGDPPQFGPWMALKDGHLDGVQISFKRFPNGTVYYKLRNTYPVAVKVKCQFCFTNSTGKRSTETGCDAKAIQPSKEARDPGWFDFGVASIDESSLRAKVKSVNAADNLDDTKFAASGREATRSAPPGGTCQVGQKRDDSDGEHRAPWHTWEERAVPDAKSCPPVTIGGTVIHRLAVYRRTGFFDVVTKDGVVTQCKTGYQTSFFKCISASEEMDYPAKGFSLNTPTFSGGGVRD